MGHSRRYDLPIATGSQDAERIVADAPRAAPITTLRGAEARTDPRRARTALAALLVVSLATTAIVLLVAGIHKNAQIDQLRHRGVAVRISVTGCTGQLGGSGSNAAGYSCRGDFTLGGRRYNEPIPGTTLYPPGTQLRGVAVPGDPALVSTEAAVASEHASWRVFLLPGLLAAVLCGVSAVLSARRRRRA